MKLIRKTEQISNGLITGLIGLFVFSGSTLSTHAQSTWNGGGADNNWSTPANWTGGGAPSSSTTTDIQLSGGTRLQSFVDAPFTVKTLWFNADSGAFVLSGSTITIQGKGSENTPAVRNNSTLAQTINNNIIVAGPSAFLNAGGGMTINGNIAMQAATGFQSWSTSVGKELVLNGVLSGAASVNFNGAANANVIVNGVNTYTGATYIWAQTVLLGGNVLYNTDSALGKSTAAIQMGASDSAATSGLLTNGAFSVERAIQIMTPNSGVTSATIGGNTTDVSSFKADITMGNTNVAAQGLTVTAANGGRVNISGNLTRATGATGAGDILVKTGKGIVALSGANNSYSGSTNVNAGTLLVNGTLNSSANGVTVASTATLGGFGTINRSVTVKAGGILSAGDIDAFGKSQGGTLTITNNLSLENGAVLKFDLASVGSINNDLINVTGNLVLSGSLQITALSGFGEGTYRLFNYTGTLTDNLLTIAASPVGYNYSINTLTGGQIDLVVTAVPEPGSLAMLAGGLSLMAGMRLRRKNG